MTWQKNNITVILKRIIFVFKVMVNYTKRAVKGVSVALIFSLLASTVAYLTKLYLARELEPMEYGLFSSVFAFVTFFLFFRDLGLGQALVKLISKYNLTDKYDEIKTTISSVFLFQFLSSLLLGIFFVSFSKL